MKDGCIHKTFSSLTFKHLHYFLLGISFITLGFAYGAEYSLGHMPCDFCSYERGIYMAIIIVAFLSLKTGFLQGYKGITIQLIILSFGIALTFYHVGMEHHWWTGPSGCSGIKNASSLEDFRKQLMQTDRPHCDQITWRFFNISATLWNLVILAGSAFLTCLGFYLPTDKQNLARPENLPTS